MGILKDTFEMKRTFIAWLLVFVAALGNAKHFIVGTFDKDDDDLINMMENEDDIGNNALDADGKDSACLQRAEVKGLSKGGSATKGGLLQRLKGVISLSGEEGEKPEQI
eukprot:TRINITY_DN14758_c0_g1_i1.p1 TRINITY_DN14758_c0_g1~~TRINITY_DN14758_c0_g1_i1.p1  ORF type:complete len:126 (-),score=51.71 TRINITY_DN14758_c0_g1_i1:292-618(-)